MHKNAQKCVWEKTPPLSGKNPTPPKSTVRVHLAYRLCGRVGFAGARLFCVGRHVGSVRGWRGHAHQLVYGVGESGSLVLSRFTPVVRPSCLNAV